MNRLLAHAAANYRKPFAEIAKTFPRSYRRAIECFFVSAYDPAQGSGCNKISERGDQINEQ